MSSRPQDKWIALVMLAMFMSASTLCGYTQATTAHKTVLYRSEYKQSVDPKIRTTAIVKRYKWVTVTGYCDCSICCGKWSGTKKMKVGQIAASRSMPFGTRVRINGKVYIVNDRLAKRYDKRMDIYFRTHKEALEWGKKVLKVEVLK